MDKDQVLVWLERRGTRRIVEGMARYGTGDRADGEELKLIGSSCL
jgi:hypothetical protein